jgi:NitT/TauT family transport system permease protein
LQESWVTLLEIAVGFAAGVIGGIAFGIMLGFMPRLRRILMPYLQAIYGIPRPAMAPIFVLWFGIGIVSKMMLIFSLVYFILVVYVLAGFRQINQNLVRLAGTVGASRLQVLVKIIIPSVLPSIFAGMKLGIGLAIVGAVVGEFISSDKGLGNYILRSSHSGDTVGIYVGLCGLGIISLFLVWIMEVFDRRLFGWQREFKL